MRRIFLLCLLAALFAAPAFAQDIAVSGAYAFATSPAARNGAVFLTLMNETGAAQSLTGASAEVSEKVELHTMSMEGGIMRMRKVESYDLPPGEYTKLEPMGSHIMLLGLKNPLKAGESFPLTLSFEDRGDVTVDVAVMPPGQKPPGKHEENSYP